MSSLLIFSLIVCFCNNGVNAVNLPGPRVYVVTPSPRPLKIDEGRSAPFYYRSWMRMDSPQNSTTTTTTPKTKTPDLIFAEFESDSSNNMKSIRKLLERERIGSKTTTTTTTTTSRPIYVPDEETDDVTRVVNYGLPVKTQTKDETKPSASDSTDYFAMYNKLYNNAPALVYVPSTTSPSTTLLTSTTTTTTTTPTPMNVENIWHIIDNEKYDQYSGKWEEESITTENLQGTSIDITLPVDGPNVHEDKREDQGSIDENFALPGFGTNPGNGGENESRAIRTEPNIRFPYVNLKPFQMKNPKKPILNGFSNGKKDNNMFTSLDNFHEIKKPVRGEAQDVVAMRQPIDRYNPAQPYLPQSEYGSNSKQSSGSTTITKAVANLVPPPPPPPPKLTANDFPSPSTYESFPPYAPAPVSNPAPPPPAPPAAPAPKPVVTMYQPPAIDSTDDFDSNSPPDYSDRPPMDVGYRYKQPSAPVQFIPTIPPLTKPFQGYTYNKPTMTIDTPPTMDMNDKPDFQGYHYSKPEPPSPPQDYSPANYGHHGPSYHHDSDYPELIFNKPHGDMVDTKGGDDMKGTDMMPPPPPPDMKPDHHGASDDSAPPTDEHGFPHDFPGDLKFHHDFDDHDFHHYHHHTTTTTTTEQPRVNRYSYYYLGKKLYYLPLYFSVYFIIYVGALIIKAVLRHKITYPNSWRPNDMTASFFSKRSIESWDFSNDKLHDITGRVTHAIATAAQKYVDEKKTE